MTFPSTQVTSPPQLQAEVIVNEAFETLEHQSVYGKRHATTSGLTWGYYGGRWGGFSVADGTVTLTGSSTNYLVANRSTGAVSVSTATTNWNLTGSYARIYKITTSSTAVTAVEDHRAGPSGAHGASDLSTVTPVGRHAIWVSAAAMQPSASGGCAALAAVALSAGQPDLVTLDFDATTQEYAQFSITMPKSWNEGTVTFSAVWSHPATTTNFGVVWDLQAVAVSDDDTIAASFGTAQTSTDTGGTTNDLYKSPESSAITVAGTPAAEDTVFFRLSRVTGNGSDNMAVDARLHGIVLYVTTDAGNDA
jgi:hypothetical protein